MEKQQFIQLMDDKIKLIRTEYGLSQDKMAAILGISKKTLIEIEKSRKSLGWTNSVALASIFTDSTIIRDAVGGDSSSFIIALALKNIDVDYPKTWGGRIWWKTIIEKKGYRIQQNMFSRHFRLIDQDDRRIYASFSSKDTEAMLEKIFRS
jgi:DNA-binding XRE family transcriptional regulator